MRDFFVVRICHLASKANVDPFDKFFSVMYSVKIAKQNSLPVYFSALVL